MRFSIALIVVLAISCDAQRPPAVPAAQVATKGAPMSAPASNQEANDAVSLAVGFLPSLSVSPEEYRVFFVENILSGEGASPTRWRIGFKRRALVPDQPGGRIGKGGEVYVEVDTSARHAQRGKGGD